MSEGVGTTPGTRVVDGRQVVGVLSIRDLSIEDLAAMHAELESRRTIAERAW